MFKREREMEGGRDGGKKRGREKGRSYSGWLKWLNVGVVWRRGGAGERGVLEGSKEVATDREERRDRGKTR